MSRFLSSRPLQVDRRESRRTRHGVLKSGWLPCSLPATAQQHYFRRATPRLAFASLTVVHLYTHNVPSSRSTCGEAITFTFGRCSCLLAHNPHDAPPVGREVLMAFLEELRGAAQRPAENIPSLMSAVIAPVSVKPPNTQSSRYPLRYPAAVLRWKKQKQHKKKECQDRTVDVLPYSSAYLQPVLHGTGDALQAISSDMRLAL